MRPSHRVLTVTCALLLATAWLSSTAGASEPLSDFNATFQSLAVNSKGEALVTYQRSDGKVRHLLAWGAVNANAPTDQAVPQVHFKYDYSGGWGK